MIKYLLIFSMVSWSLGWGAGGYRQTGRTESKHPQPSLRAAGPSPGGPPGTVSLQRTFPRHVEQWRGCPGVCGHCRGWLCHPCLHLCLPPWFHPWLLTFFFDPLCPPALLCSLWLIFVPSFFFPLLVSCCYFLTKLRTEMVWSQLFSS